MNFSDRNRSIFLYRTIQVTYFIQAFGTNTSFPVPQLPDFLKRSVRRYTFSDQKYQKEMSLRLLTHTSHGKRVKHLCLGIFLSYFFLGMLLQFLLCHSPLYFWMVQMDPMGKQDTFCIYLCMITHFQRLSIGRRGRNLVGIVGPASNFLQFLRKHCKRALLRGASRTSILGSVLGVCVTRAFAGSPQKVNSLSKHLLKHLPLFKIACSFC